jgi:uncharacterized protein YcbK (DUF882 family)
MWRPAGKARALGWAPFGLILMLGAGSARADVTHVVGRGHTLEAIAHRYHVTVKAIVDANHLKDTRHLKVGDTLVIPGVAAKGKVGPEKEKGSRPGANATYAMRPKTPGVVHATRLATTEDFVVRTSSRHGHASPTALTSFEKMMRSTGGLTHPPDPRLVELIGVVSNHFGSRRIEVISGFRPYSPTQYTPHSNHNVGRALDFRVVGVPNEVLRDFCRTLKNVGVGYYPNSTFVHLDVRSSSAFWIDYSRPGEPPRYDTPDSDADEATADVTDSDARPAAPSATSDPLPALPPAPGRGPETQGQPQPHPGVAR